MLLEELNVEAVKENVVFQPAPSSEPSKAAAACMIYCGLGEIVVQELETVPSTRVSRESTTAWFGGAVKSMGKRKAAVGIDTDLI